LIPGPEARPEDSEAQLFHGAEDAGNCARGKAKSGLR
jgi:hypothetical protein